MSFLRPIALLVAGSLAAAPATAQSGAAFHHALIGEWTGTLEYRDYQPPHGRVTLPTTATIGWMTDSSAVLIAFTFDDGPGKTVKSLETLQANESLDTLTWQSVGDSERNPLLVREVRRIPGDTLIIIAEQVGRDDDRPALIRETFTITANSISVLKETQPSDEPMAFRHAYRLERR
jgi:hypothetical protein